MFPQEIREGGLVFGIKEELHSRDIKPFYLGTVIFAPTGKVPWQIPRNRCSYRFEPGSGEARITDVVLESVHQGHGTARKMVELAERRFREHGITKVVGYSDPEVHGFWLKLGYQISPSNDILKLL